ncbi:MAG: DNA recombination protein RmuC [Phycisphaerales bacterium]
MTDALLVLAVVLSGASLLAIGGVLLLTWRERSAAGGRGQAISDEVSDRLRDLLAEQASQVRTELSLARREQADQEQRARAELSGTLQSRVEAMTRELRDADEKLSALQVARTAELGEAQQRQLADLRAALESLQRVLGAGLTEMRERVGTELRTLAEGNQRKLDEMRGVVEQKLQTMLEERLGAAFRSVGERLEQVHQGLGEMKGLMGDVGDLKRVLANVKVRGTFGEVQLGSILEEYLAPEQFKRNVEIRAAPREHVEYAICLPGGENGGTLLLPIDAKFPREDYERLLLAAERADPDGVREASTGLANSIRRFAKEVGDKYVAPPRTTDFAIIFLPTEGLYAEVLRQPGLAETVRRQHKVMLAGPSNLAALLNALQVGFRTLAIQKRSSEVWDILGRAKLEFGKFAAALEDVKAHLEKAHQKLEGTGVRSRAIERALRTVERGSEALLPAGDPDGAALPELDNPADGASDLPSRGIPS